MSDGLLFFSGTCSLSLCSCRWPPRRRARPRTRPWTASARCSTPRPSRPRAESPGVIGSAVGGVRRSELDGLLLSRYSSAGLFDESRKFGSAVIGLQIYLVPYLALAWPALRLDRAPFHVDERSAGRFRWSRLLLCEGQSRARAQSAGRRWTGGIATSRCPAGRSCCPWRACWCSSTR